jgi:hypothetical protein
MAEYIERDEAIAALTEFLDDQTVSKYVSVENCLVARGAIERTIKVIESLPAADIEPVKRGRWEKNVRGDYSTVCSECGYGFPTDGYAWIECNRRSDEREYYFQITDVKNYCPNCGARMDEEAK